MRLTAFALAAVLAGCGGDGPTPPPDPVLIADLGLYLTQYRCPDGSPPHMCALSVPQKASDPMFWRRMDWPAPGWQTSESVAADRATPALSTDSAGLNRAGAPTGAVTSGEAVFITTWAYGPGPFSAARGDGGEVYVSDGTKVRIAATQDGGTPGIQRFPLWGLFDNRTPRGKWRDVDPLARARLDTLTFPASGFGLTEIVADTITSEHYDFPGYGGKVEILRMADKWGRLGWFSFGPPGTRTVPADLAERCPAGPLTAPPDVHPDWVLYDCRITTRLVPADGSMSVSGFGWPPAGFVP